MDTSATIGRIEMLGELKIRNAGHVITRFRTQKTGALLAYLALHRHQIHPREQLCELFWPESEPEAGRTNVRVALNALRRQMETLPIGSLLTATHEHVRLNPEMVTTDVAEFEGAVRAAALQPSPILRREELMRAAALYQGPLLPGFYEDWALWERERLADIYFRILYQLTDLLEQEGEMEAALDYAHRAVQTDPLCEEAHAALIRLYMRIQQPATALRQYQELERRLQENFATQPLPETRALLKEQTPRVERLPARMADAISPKTIPDSLNVSNLPSPLLSGDSEIFSLPLTRFFGREDEIERIHRALSAPGTRLVTLMGLGGAGKTRLAIEIGKRLRNNPDRDLYFVPLAAVSDTRSLILAIADALGIERLNDNKRLDAVAERLKSRPSLLILDNFEQLTDQGSEIVCSLLERAPTLICLITSRYRLNIIGERLFPVAPLPVPKPVSGFLQAQDFPSVQLFLDRAQAVRPDFILTERNAEAIASVCEKLEGIPLALELAAAWVSVLTPAQMLERLQRRFDFLISSHKGISERHRTLRSTIEWSYKLLPAPLQLFFCKLSVFRDGWSLEAAEEISAESKAMEYLRELHDRSFIVAEEQEGGAIRYRLLETLREFAGESLPEAEREPLALRHAAYFLELAEQAEKELGNEATSLWNARLESEIHNLRQAWHWCLMGGSYDMGARLCVALDSFWYEAGYSQERFEWRRLAMSQKERLSPEMQAAVYWRVSQFEKPAPAALLLKECVAIYRALEEKGGEAWIHVLLAVNQADLGQFDQALSLFDHALSLWREIGEEDKIGLTLAYLAGLHTEMGRLEQAKPLLEECVAIAQRHGHLHSVAKLRTAQGVIAWYQGEMMRATALLTEGLQLFRNFNQKGNMILSLHNLAQVKDSMGDYTAASSLLEEAMELQRVASKQIPLQIQLTTLWVAWHQGDVGVLQTSRETEGHILARQPDPQAWDSDTKRTLGMLRTLQGEILAHQGSWEEALDCWKGAEQLLRVSEARYTLSYVLAKCGIACWRLGRYEEAAALLGECLQICEQCVNRPCIVYLGRQLGCLLAKTEEREKAVLLLSVSEYQRSRMQIALTPIERAELEQILHEIRNALDPERWNLLWTRGQNLSYEQAIENMKLVSTL